MKRACLAFLYLIICVALFAQQKTLTLQDVVIGNYYYLRPDDYDQICWMKEGETFVYKKDNAIFGRKAGDKDASSILSLQELNTMITSNGMKELSYFPELTWHNKDNASFINEGQLILINVTSKIFLQKNALPEGSENHEFSPNYKYIAYTKGNNLQVLDMDGNIRIITNDSNKGIVNGNTVHRVEFGIEKGTFWSPQSNYLAFYCMDETMVTDYPLVDVNTRIASLKTVKYPMAGMTSHEVTLGVYSIKEGTTLFLETGKPADQYLTNICWSPDEKYIYIAVLNREQNHMKMNHYDARTGKLVKTLFEETHEKYVEPLHPIYFLPSNNQQFIWQSRRDGFNHLYLYSVDGKLLKQLTQGVWEVTELLQQDATGNWIYFIGTKESPVERHIYKMNISTGEIVQLSKDKGVHDAFISAGGSYILDRFSSMKNPNQINLINQDGKLINKLVASGNPLAEYSLGEAKIGTIMAADDKTQLYYKMFLPTDFNPKIKYPTIIYVYGGPHAQMALNSWYDPTELWMQYMAQRGYIVFTLDNRGSADRGRDFENCTFRQLGQEEMKDQMKGVEYLKSLGYIDAERIGLHGWSYGGYMTISLMLHYPEVFKAGVAGGPVIDWKYYEVMYGERYMDTPQENPDGYEQANLNNYVENLQGRLLIIHGSMDSTVVWQHSLSFLNACIEKGKLVDYFVYPNHEHNVRGMDRIHLWSKVTQYFIDYL